MFMKEKYLKPQKVAELLRKCVFPNNVKKPGRCHNLVNGRSRRGNVLQQTLILVLILHAIWYCLHHTLDKFLKPFALALKWKIQNRKQQRRKEPSLCITEVRLQPVCLSCVFFDLLSCLSKHLLALLVVVLLLPSFATLPVLVSFSSMWQRDRKRVAMQCFSWEILIHSLTLRGAVVQLVCSFIVR